MEALRPVALIILLVTLTQPAFPSRGASPGQEVGAVEILERTEGLQGEVLRQRLGALLEQAQPDTRARVAFGDGLLHELGPDAPAETLALVHEWMWRAEYFDARYASAREQAERFVSVAERSGSDDLIGDARMAQGLTAFDQDRLADAAEALDLALEAYGPKESVRVGNALSLRAAIAFRHGEYTLSSDYHTACLEMAESLGNLPLQARAWNNLGLVYKHLESHRDARDALERASELARTIGNENLRISILGNLGSAYRELGQFELALATQREALAYDRAEGRDADVALGHTRIGLTLAAMGRRDEAIEELRLALSMRRELGLEAQLSRALLDLGRLLVENGESEEGLRLLEEARDELGEAPGLVERDVHHALVEAYLAEERLDDAARTFDRFLELERELTNAELTERHAELTTRYEQASEQNELERLRTQKELDRLALQEERARVLGLVAGTTLLAGLCVALWLLSRTRARMGARLAEQNTQLEEALGDSLASERLYRRLFEDGVSGRILLDPEGDIILEANRQATLWLRAPAEELAGRPLAEVAPSLRLEGDAGPWELETERGTLLIDAASAGVEVDGRQLLLITLRDVTSMRLLEEEQQRSQSLSSLGMLAAGIAHDFNNALTGVLGNLTTARSRTAGMPVDELLEGAEEATLQAGHLADQLLSFARGGAPVLDTRDLAGELERWVAFSRAGSAVQTRLELAADLWPARFDAGQIARVIQNLVLNAQQAMEGEGVLVVRAENRHVDRDPELAPGPYVQVRVRDTGPGIAPELRESIFEPYVSSKAESRGLGLATSAATLRRHGGLLRLVDDDAPGACFEMLLPATPQAPLPSSQPGSSGKEPARLTGRVLVLDDDPMVRQVFASMLARLGLEVVTRADCDAALVSLSEAGAFDLAIVDATIPGSLGGGLALKELRQVQPELAAILTSGYSERGELSSYASHGFDGVLKKPFELEALGQVVREVLGPRKPAETP